MGEDLINSTASLTMKVLDIILKLLQELGQVAVNAAGNNVSKEDITVGKPGVNKIADLENYCQRNGIPMVTSDQSITKEDMKKIAEKAKDNGIKVAFKGSKGKDCIHPCCAQNEADIFKKICTEVMQEKIAERPQDLGNFKVQAWEIPFLTAELNKHDLTAQFGKTPKGEYFCLYEKVDEKAIKIAKNEFVSKCNEIEKGIELKHESSGFYSIVDKKAGKEITFDALPTRSQLEMQIRAVFGYDSIKADILCAKFGQEQLDGAEKKRFFSSDPQNEFSKIDTNVTLKGESILVKPFPCWRLMPKSPKEPKIVFQGENGAFCVLQPETSTKKAMAEKLRQELHITDADTVNALVEKAVGVSDYYKKLDKQNLTCNRQFIMDQDEHGNYTLKELSSGREKLTGQKAVTTDIQRTGETTFTVSGADHPTLNLSLSNKKTALQQLKEMYCGIGISEAVALSMAKEVFKKAELQSAVQILDIEEIKIKESEMAKQNPLLQLTVRYGNKQHDFNMSDREQAIKKISEHFQVPELAAVQVLDQAMERVEEKTQFHVHAQNIEDSTVYYGSQAKSEQSIDTLSRSVDLSKENYRQPEKMSLNEALNRHPEKGSSGSYDNIVVCSPDNFNNYVVSQARNNGKRLVHEYSVFRDGVEQTASDSFKTNGIFTDENSLDESNKPIMIGNTTYWNALKQDIHEKSGLPSENVLVFKSQTDFENYRKDVLANPAINTPQVPKPEIPMTRSMH